MIYYFTPFIPLSFEALKERGRRVSKEALPYCLYKTQQTSYTRFGGVTTGGTFQKLGYLQKEVSRRMVRARDWNKSEFKIVMNSYGLSIEEVMQKLQRCRPEEVRSRDAIEIVIGGIHIYHLGKENH